MAKRGDWLKANPEKAREMGRKGGRQFKVTSHQRSLDYQAGYAAGWKAGRRKGCDGELRDGGLRRCDVSGV